MWYSGDLDGYKNISTRLKLGPFEEDCLLRTSSVERQQASDEPESPGSGKPCTPSIEWLESIKEIKNRHYKPSKSYSTTSQENKLQILQNQCHWVGNFKTKLLQKDSYFSDFFWERYTLSKLTLESVISKNRKIKENVSGLRLKS